MMILTSSLCWFCQRFLGFREQLNFILKPDHFLNITRRTRDVMNLVKRVQRFLKKRGDGCVPVKRSPAMKTFEKLDPALQKFLCGHSRLVFLDKSRGRLLPGPGPIEKRCFRVVENRSRPSSF